MTLVTGAMSFRFTARLNMRFGARATLLPAIAAIAAGMLVFARTPVDASYLADIPPPVVLTGVGAGLAFPSVMTLAMSGASPDDSGLVSGLVNTSVQVGGAIGLAVLAPIATERTNILTALSALNSGYHLAYPIGVVLIAAAAVVVAAVLPPEAVGRELAEAESSPASASPANPPVSAIVCCSGAAAGASADS